MANKIFNIGLPKSGTTSLHNALMILGYRSRHNPLDFRALTYKHGVYKYPRDDWDALTNFGEHFYPQLDLNYPNSKFILTIREKEAWVSSAEKWYSQPQENPPIDYQCILETFGCMTFQYDRFAYLYDHHLSNVKDYFKDRPDDLLIFDYGKNNSWNDLCTFLDKPIPSQAFPHSLKGGSPRNSLCRRMGNTLINSFTRRF